MDDFSDRQLSVFNSIHNEIRKHLEFSKYEIMLEQHANAIKADVAVGDTFLIIETYTQIFKSICNYLASSW